MSDQWTTCVGVFADSVGAIEYITDEVVRDSRGQVVAVTRWKELEHAPASKYAAFQPPSVPVRWRHRDEIGKVVLLHRSQGRLSAVAVLPGPVELYADMVDLFWSSGTSTRGDGPLEIRELSLTPSPATSALAPVRFFEGLPRDSRGRSGVPRALLDRADEILRAAHNDPLQVRVAFDDHDRPERPTHNSRGAREPGLEYIVRPATIVAVNGRPVKGSW